MVLFNFIFYLLCTSRGSSLRCVVFCCSQQAGYSSVGLMGPWVTQCVPWLCHVLEMTEHVALFAAVASGLRLLQPLQTGYRTLCCGPLTCLFIGYGVSYHADKTAGAWSSPHIPISPPVKEECALTRSYTFAVTCTFSDVVRFSAPGTSNHNGHPSPLTKSRYISHFLSPAPVITMATPRPLTSHATFHIFHYTNVLYRFIKTQQMKIQWILARR